MKNETLRNLNVTLVHMNLRTKNMIKECCQKRQNQCMLESVRNNVYLRGLEAGIANLAAFVLAVC